VGGDSESDQRESPHSVVVPSPVMRGNRFTRLTRTHPVTDSSPDTDSSGRFVKQEQWERWRAEPKLASASKNQVKVGMEGSCLLPLRRSGSMTPGIF